MRRTITPLPKRVREAFEGRTYLSLAKLAKAFQLGENTLRRHAVNGTLPSHSKGFGKYRIHRAFTLGDAEIFWHRLQPPPVPPKARRKKKLTPAGVAKTTASGLVR